MPTNRLREIVDFQFATFKEDLIDKLEDGLREKVDLLKQIEQLNEKNYCLSVSLNDAKNCIAVQEREINRLNSMLAKKITVSMEDA